MLSSSMTLVLGLRGHRTREDDAESCKAQLRKETGNTVGREISGPSKIMMTLGMGVTRTSASYKSPIKLFLSLGWGERSQGE